MNQIERDMIYEIRVAKENIEMATLEYEAAKVRYYSYITSI